MIGGFVNLYPIQPLVNYWETERSISARLDALVQVGTHQVSSFVPWQAVESDISQALLRFLQICHKRNILVNLIVTPEVGVQYPNSGLPKDLMSQRENRAEVFTQQRAFIHLSPNTFSIPSPFSSEFRKRFQNYLSRLDSFLGDLATHHPKVLQTVQITTTGSFWKYLRSPLYCVQTPFGGPAGDFSPSATLEFRKEMEKIFSQSEFSDPSPAEANRWKSRSLESKNRKWFFQQAEGSYWQLTSRVLHKKIETRMSPKFHETELFTPEADPSLNYVQIFKLLGNASPNFEKLSEILSEVSFRGSTSKHGFRSPSIHWTSTGDFAEISRSQREFLTLKSFLLSVIRGGHVFLEDQDWIGLSQKTRNQVENLYRTLCSNEPFRLPVSSLYLCPHLWSENSSLYSNLKNQMGHQIRLCHAFDSSLGEPSLQLLVIDPDTLITKELIRKALAWARAGRTLVLPRSRYFTFAAKKELEAIVSGNQKIDFNLQVPYSLHQLSDGKLFLFDCEKMKDSDNWTQLGQAILAFSETSPLCRSQDPRVELIPLLNRSKKGVLFVLNSHSKPIQTEIHFQQKLRISSISLGPTDASPQLQEFLETQKLELELPPLGFTPLQIQGLGLEIQNETAIASKEANQVSENAKHVALSELPGLGLEDNLEQLWNL